jgi:hypothetical protein
MASAALQGKERSRPFSCLNCTKKYKSSAFSTEFFSTLLYRCSACVFELPLQRLCFGTTAAALVFFSTAAKRQSAAAPARPQRCTSKKVSIPEGYPRVRVQ